MMVILIPLLSVLVAALVLFLLYRFLIKKVWVIYVLIFLGVLPVLGRLPSTLSSGLSSGQISVGMVLDASTGIIAWGIIFAIIAGVAKLFKRKGTTVPAMEKNENVEEERSS